MKPLEEVGRFMRDDLYVWKYLVLTILFILWIVFSAGIEMNLSYQDWWIETGQRPDKLIKIFPEPATG